MTMTRADRIANYVAIVLPFVGVLIAIVLLWDSAVDGIDLAIFAVMYFLVLRPQQHTGNWKILVTVAFA